MTGRAGRLGFAVVLAAAVSACGPAADAGRAGEGADQAGGAGEGAPPEPQYGGELIYALSGETYSLFPGRQPGSQAQDTWLYALEGLVEIDENNQIVPWLATDWSFSEDGREATFHLREGVRFHDGTPFDAEAVAFVFQEAIAKDFVHAHLLEGLVEVTADDAYTVTFHFAEPFAALLANLSHRSMVFFSPTAYREHGEEWMATNMVGTGPFMQEEVVRGEYVRFVRNPDYWQEGLPYLDAVTLPIVPEVSVRSAMLEAGEIDRAHTVNDFEIERLQADEQIRLRIVPSTRQLYVAMNHTRPPLDDPRVRRAFNYAMDKVGIVGSVYAGVGAVPPEAPVLSRGVVGFQDMRAPGEASIFPYDPDRARALLDEAGIVDVDGDGVRERADGSAVSLSLFSRRGGTKGEGRTAELVQTMLGEVGIDVRLEFYESSAFGAATNLGPEDALYDMAMLSWGVPTADPDEPMMMMTYSKAWKPFGSNRMFYASEVVDEVSLRAHHEVDPGRRDQHVRAWMDELMADAPVIFLPVLTLNLATRTYVHGDRILAVDQYPARFAWIDGDERARQGVRR